MATFLTLIVESKSESHNNFRNPIYTAMMAMYNLKILTEQKKFPYFKIKLKFPTPILLVLSLSELSWQNEYMIHTPIH